jgi:hypothetical protein
MSRTPKTEEDIARWLVREKKWDPVLDRQQGVRGELLRDLKYKALLAVRDELKQKLESSGGGGAGGESGQQQQQLGPSTSVRVIRSFFLKKSE